MQQTDMIRYPIGIQTFSDIVEGQWRYIDKTGYVYDLARRYRFVFLSRPRRFGKSLFTSTLRCYFEGRKDLFEGLAAGRLEKDWTKYPVLHFDMSTAKHMDSKRLESELNYKLLGYEEIYGRKEGEIDCNQRLAGLIRRAYEQTGRKVVVLLDEYDAPLLDVLADDTALAANRQIMRNFYSPLKACDPMLRFVFITGITKFSQLSIFSELNNLRNISLLPQYAAICGITQEELQTQFSDDIDRMAENMGMGREDTIALLKDNYDGYHFSHSSPDVYNPYSLITSLDSGEIESTWFASGTPTYIISQMSKYGFKPQDFSEITAAASDFDAPTENMKSIIPLLYQSGYLTIKAYDRTSQQYTLAVPNSEVRYGLMRNLVSFLASPEAETPANRLMADMFMAFRADDINKVMERLKVFLSSIPYTDNAAKDYEGHYQALLYVVFSMLCKFVDIEVRTPRGRADIVVDAPNKVYIIEVKLDKSSAFAIDQIGKQNYAERFFIMGKPIVEVGVNFDSEQGNTTDWSIRQRSEVGGEE